MWRSPTLHHRPIRQGSQRRTVGSLTALFVQPLAMQYAVDLVGGFQPLCGAKLLEAIPAALGARPMPRRERRGFIEEEELRIAPGRKDLPTPILEAQDARDPPSHLPGPDDAAVRVVQPAAV